MTRRTGTGTGKHDRARTHHQMTLPEPTRIGGIRDGEIHALERKRERTFDVYQRSLLFAPSLANFVTARSSSVTLASFYLTLLSAVIKIARAHTRHSVDTRSRRFRSAKNLRSVYTYLCVKNVDEKCLFLQFFRVFSLKNRVTRLSNVSESASVHI